MSYNVNRSMITSADPLTTKIAQAICKVFRQSALVLRILYCVLVVST